MELTVLEFWRSFFGEMPVLTNNVEIGVIVEYAVCAIVCVLVITLFFRMIIGFINGVFR